MILSRLDRLANRVRFVRLALAAITVAQLEVFFS